MFQMLSFLKTWDRNIRRNERVITQSDDYLKKLMSEKVCTKIIRKNNIDMFITLNYASIKASM